MTQTTKERNKPQTNPPPPRSTFKERQRKVGGSWGVVYFGVLKHSTMTYETINDIERNMKQRHR